MRRMTSEIIVALVAFAGTLIGTFGGIITSAKLTNYRIKQLEDRVNEHNQFARRMPVLEEKQKMDEQRIDALERKVEG